MDAQDTFQDALVVGNFTMQVVQNLSVVRFGAIVFTLVVLFAQASSAGARTAEDYNSKLGSGINLGNALEAPKEGDWGVVLKAEYFPLIKSAGFKHVRVPVSWSTHAAKEAPYTIDPAFFERVDWVI